MSDSVNPGLQGAPSRDDDDLVEGFGADGDEPQPEPADTAAQADDQYELEEEEETADRIDLKII